MSDLNSFQSINSSLFFDSVKFRSGSGYYLVIDFCIVMFYMLMILMKVGESYSLYAKYIHLIWCRSLKFSWKSKFCSESGSGSGSGSWYYFGFQCQTYISYIEDTHQILFESANSFKSYCVHMQSPRTYVHPDIQTDRQADRQTDRRKFFLACFVF